MNNLPCLSACHFFVGVREIFPEIFNYLQLRVAETALEEGLPYWYEFSQLLRLLF